MELSKNILDGISIAGDISKISDNVYSHLLTEICEVAVSRPIRKGRDCKSLDEKTAYSSLLSFLLEAAKHDADPMSLSSVLEECRMDSSRISMFQNKFQENKDKIQSQLSRIGRSFDHVIDVKWRQDYVIKNPLTNSTDDVTFACSMEQLQFRGQLSGRSRLPDLLKCGCHKLILLDVSMSFIAWSTDYEISLNPRILCLEDMFEADLGLQHL
ncbi:COMM domain-containing protein 3-like isoform X2 [Stegodyphus dumicola]|uniref:COMM domain-containing protein 3-like isoform X2 n=1 Tax=Stegodyphus dumicola TaxID=202533 RepID=UPI0015B02AAE|nr:COMM domain-containing protein 3-like isoform X2 [Stegodyphus dumicola]